MTPVIKTVCICGAGTMGSGIAQVCANAGYNTILYDVNHTAIETARTKIENNLEQLVQKQKIDESEKTNILKKIQFISTIHHCIADLFIEAVIEKMGAKVSLFNQLTSFNNPNTIYASNTSSLSIAKIAEEVNMQNQFIGLHFFNPAPVMKLVEVVKTNQTNKTLLSAVTAFVKTLNKTPVVCKDSPGFIVNRVARPYYIESLRLIEESRISVEVIDRLMEAQGFKMGPFRLMDLIGNDINYAVSCSVYEQLNTPKRLKPSAIQKEKVEQGALGKKTGKGYYQY